MARTSRKSMQGGAPPSRRRPASVRLATERDPAARSPALHRQELLQESFERFGERLGEHAHDTVLWSQRRTLAFIGLTCGGFWTFVIVGLAHLARQG